MRQMPEWTLDLATKINNQYELGLRDMELKVLAWTILRASEQPGAKKLRTHELGPHKDGKPEGPGEARK